MQEGQKEKSSEGTLLAEQKVRAYLNIAQKDENLWSAFLVFLGALSLLGAIPFYPIAIAFVLALACGAVAYKSPPLGVALGFILILPALSYQSAIFGWVGLMILALIFFEVFEHWGEIALLEVLVLLPFAVFPFSLLGGLIYFGMVWGSFHFGSAKSMIISTASVFMVLLLSSIWLVPNSAFFGINTAAYSALPAIQLTKPALPLISVIPGIIPALTNLANLQAVSQAWAAMGHIGSNMITLIIADGAIAQIAVWAAVLFFAGWFPGKSRNRWRQTIAALPILLVPAAYFIICAIYHYPFYPAMFLYAGLSVGAVALIDLAGVTFSRERKIERGKKTKKFGKFGFGDAADSGETLDSVGGYEDVKKELRDSILLPLQSKDLAFAYNLKVPSGILLFGPPGTGKTLLMRALANDMDYSFYPVKTPEILSQWYGESLPYSEKMLVKGEDGRVRLREIGEVVEKRLSVEVLAFDKSGMARFSKVTGHIKHKSTSPIYEVKTRTGRRIKVTAYHSLFSFDGSKISEVKTSELVPKSSYIAIPSSIPFSENPIIEMDLLSHLKEDDYGLSVSGVSAYALEAIGRLGEEKAMEILGYNSRSYMKQALKAGRAIKVRRFLALMDAAHITADSSKISVIAKRKRFPALIDVDEDFSTFLGLWVAEGSYNRKDTVRISVSRKEEKKAAALCRKLFGHATIYRKKNSNASDIYMGSKPLYVLMHDILGIHDGAHEKSVPDIAFSLGKKNMGAFLRGYFSGDGTIYSNQHGTAIVEASTASRNLADATLYLLLHFGIVGTVYPKKEWTGTPSWRVSFNGVENLRKFSEISFLDSRRAAKLTSAMESASWHRSPQVPIIGELRGIVAQKFPKWSASSTIGTDALMGVAFEEEPEFLVPMRNGIYLDRVESVKRVEDEEYVYDVSVEGLENFTAGFGGIFAHNSEKNVVEVFNRARDTAPAILFFDEIDAIGKRRALAGNDSVTPRVLSALLQEMDGAKKSKKQVIVVGATNVPDQLDPALMRPGRFDKIIYMHLPDDAARKAIFKVSLKGLPVSKSVDYDKLAKKSRRFSGADIANVVKTALRKAAEDAKRAGKVVPITMDHILGVLEKTKPSTSLGSLEDYERFQLDFQRSESGSGAEEDADGKKKKKAVGWDDVAGLDDLKGAFKEAIEIPLLHPELLEEFKVKPSKGILLFGPPGTGKTLTVRAASNELDVSFLTISGAQLMQQGYAHAVNVIKETFNRARENPPSVIFVDEIETFAPARGMGRSDIVGQFLVEMDGVKGNEGVLVVGATNRPDILDKALLRPGRFDKVFYVHPPDEKGRKELFKIHLGKFTGGLDIGRLAEATAGFTGADIAALSQQAKMGMLREKLSGKKAELETSDVEKLLSAMKPSVTRRMLEEYESFVEEYGERR
ncbi:AAA family ATPase [Candidatus Micrarchaeota archaeon]|nr:AAA family ATPase [Candidatus Micrarchaeota archaeon]